jgi:hypothetical protein
VNGYVKLYRKLLDNPIICKDSDHLAIWVYLLLNATHDNIDMLFNGKRITLYPGQLITGRKSISSELNISESKVHRVIKTFESEQQIEQQISNKNRLITVLNWSSYQSSEQQNEQQVNNNRTTSEQQVNTNKNDKNVKNDKNKEYIGSFDQFILDNPLYEKPLREYRRMRIDMKKKMTARAEELFIAKLKELINKGYNGLELIDEALSKNWLSIYEPKKQIAPREDILPEYENTYQTPIVSDSVERSKLIEQIRKGTK